MNKCGRMEHAREEETTEVEMKKEAWLLVGCIIISFIIIISLELGAWSWPWTSRSNFYTWFSIMDVIINVIVNVVIKTEGKCGKVCLLVLKGESEQVEWS